MRSIRKGRSISRYAKSATETATAAASEANLSAASRDQTTVATDQPATQSAAAIQSAIEQSPPHDNVLVLPNPTSYSHALRKLAKQFLAIGNALVDLKKVANPGPEVLRAIATLTECQLESSRNPAHPPPPPPPPPSTPPPPLPPPSLPPLPPPSFLPQRWMSRYATAPPPSPPPPLPPPLPRPPPPPAAVVELRTSVCHAHKKVACQYLAMDGALVDLKKVENPGAEVLRAIAILTECQLELLKT